MHAMLRSALALFLVLLPLGLAAKPKDVGLSTLHPDYSQEKTTLVIKKVLEQFHYVRDDIHINDAFARAVLDKYLETLDPNRWFFLAHDIERFEHGVGHLDDDLRRGDVRMAYDIFRVYRTRVDDRVKYALALLDKPLNFKRRETFKLDRSEEPWPRTTSDLNEIWRKRVKNDILTLRLADKKESEITKKLKRRYEDRIRRIRQLDVDDVFELFANAFTASIEPHTAYMPPSSSENFDINMSLSLEGIGAVLRPDNEFTTIQRTIPGGPAESSAQIHPGDRIIGVGQGIDGEMEDVVGWRLQDVVDKIRGPKNSMVRLLLQPKIHRSTGKTKEVRLVRKRIKLEDQAAKSFTFDDIKNAPGIRIGVIEIPTFYRNFNAANRGDRNFRSTTRDVRAILADFQGKGIDGLVIDLRGNGGGSLTEATELTGLFIPEGPVVQVKDSFGKIEVEADPDPALVYDGPMAVLVDRSSASASEIFAGAIQDYGRGIVIGEPTYGKGTVQQLIDLNRWVPGNGDDLGRLKLTMAQFFRISGGSTQRKGVEPDVFLPGAGDDEEHGERALDNPLPWTSIRPAPYRPSASLSPDAARLSRLSEKRRQNDKGFRMLEAVASIDSRDEVQLNERERRADYARREKLIEDQKNSFLRSKGIEPIDPFEEDVDHERMEAQREAIGRIQVKEAARILADAIRLDGGQRPRAAMSR